MQWEVLYRVWTEHAAIARWQYKQDYWPVCSDSFRDENSVQQVIGAVTPF